MGRINRIDDNKDYLNSTHSIGDSFSTTQSIDSFKPAPVAAEHLNIAQSLSFIFANPRISLTSFYDAASGKSCLFAKIIKGTFCKIYFLFKSRGTSKTLASS
jgi:hypothetical protein